MRYTFLIANLCIPGEMVMINTRETETAFLSHMTLPVYGNFIEPIIITERLKGGDKDEHGKIKKDH